MDSDGYESDNSDTIIPTETNHTSNSQSSVKNHTVLTESDIRQRQDDAVSHISSVFSLPPHDASRLLCFYNWEISHLHDHWFSDEQAVRNKVGLSSSKNTIVVEDCGKIIQCGICFEDFDSKNTISLSCGHPYCRSCWESYICTAIDNGPCCLFLNCPECKVAVTRDLVESLVSKEYREKYDNFFVKSYVDCNERIKWCPAPNCDYSIEFELCGCGDDDNSGGYDVNCDCSHSFCWNCVEEIHRPVECELVRMWILKNSSEAENNKWILAFTKPCPKCKRPIEKNHGCNHMTCSSPCKFQFCWLCLEDWTTHNSSYRCNAYKGLELDEKEKERINAKNSLERYRHYYERWASNHKSRQQAIQDLEKVRKNDLNTLSTIVNKPTTELEFVLEAWKQIIECRRVLKWSYTYGYYVIEKEPSKQPFFEYLQGQAEGVLEKLHGCVENELSVFLKTDNNNNNNIDGPDFRDYRSKLVGLTRVSGRYFEDLVRALENGLSEVVSVTPDVGPKKGKKRKDSTSSSQPSNEDVGPDLVNGEYSFWICDRCSLINPFSARSCQACYEG